MSKTKYSKLLLSFTTLALCVLLFLQRLTGGIWHAIFGILLIVVSMVHLCRQNRKLKHRTRAIQIIDWILIVLLAVLLITGLLLHPLQGVLALKIVHKLSAVLFVLAIIAHMVQHKKKSRA